MGYGYSLSIEPFKADNNKECLAEIKQAVPDIGDEMKIWDGYIVFEPEETFGTWRNAEDIAISVIQDHILPDETCRITWQGEDGEIGGRIIGHDMNYHIVYEPMAVTDEGLIPLHEAENLLKGRKTL